MNDVCTRVNERCMTQMRHHDSGFIETPRNKRSVRAVDGKEEEEEEETGTSSSNLMPCDSSEG